MRSPLNRSGGTGVLATAEGTYFFYTIWTDSVSNSYAVRHYLSHLLCGLTPRSTTARMNSIGDEMGKNQIRLKLAPKISRSVPIEYFILASLQSEGGIIGHFGGKPIAETLVDRNGSRYHFAGVAPRCSDGRFDVESLRTGEWIVEPGLVYLMENTAKAA